MNFNQTISVMNKTTTKNSYNEDVGTWSEAYKIGANITQLRQNEDVSSAGKQTNEVLVKFEIRRTPTTFNINVNNRLVTINDNQTWIIENVDHYSLMYKKIIRIFAYRFI